MLIRVLFLMMFVTSPNLIADDVATRIDKFLTSTLSKQDRSLLDDETALLEALSISDPSDYREFLERFLKAADYSEALVLQHIWIVVARDDRQSSAIATSSFLLESDIQGTAKFLSKIMSDADAPPRGGGRWDLSHYNLTLETAGWSGATRLLSYMFESSPAAALESVLEVFGDHIPSVEREELFKRAWTIDAGLREHGAGLVGEERMTEFLSFAESLLDLDSEMFAPYVAAVLRRERLRNVSPELRKRLEATSPLTVSFFEDEIDRSAFPSLEQPIFDRLVSLWKASGKPSP